jgi:DNA mismatch repair ATPase MutS
MDSINNLISATLLMDLFCTTFMRFIAMEKKEHAAALEEWLNVIGEFEMLNSLANLSSTTRFFFPTLNTEFKIDFKT